MPCFTVFVDFLDLVGFADIAEFAGFVRISGICCIFWCYGLCFVVSVLCFLIIDFIVLCFVGFAVLVWIYYLGLDNT